MEKGMLIRNRKIYTQYTRENQLQCHRIANDSKSSSNVFFAVNLISKDKLQIGGCGVGVEKSSSLVLKLLIQTALK